MQIAIEETKELGDDWADGKAIFIDVLLSAEDIEQISDGEIIYGSTNLRKKRVHISAGFKGFYDKGKL